MILREGETVEIKEKEIKELLSLFNSISWFSELEFMEDGDPRLNKQIVMS